MSVAILKELCEQRNINRIAIIDDIFDVPDPQRLDPENYSKFRRRYNDDHCLNQAVAQICGTSPVSLSGFAELDDKQIAPLWDSVWKPMLGDRKIKEEYAFALRDLFLAHRDDLLGMLATVAEILSLFQDDLGLKKAVTVHGTDYDPDEVADAQIVVIDYFLGLNLTVDEAFEETVQVVKNVVAAARSAGKAVPSFLLVSARPDDINVEKFRERAQLMKSRFRFFEKNDLNSDRINNMVNLHDLIDASDPYRNY